MPDEELDLTWIEKLSDQFSSMDERLDRNYHVLKRIADALTGVPITIEPSLKTDQILTELLQIEKYRRLEEAEVIEFVYPSGGGYATLPIGTTNINLSTGKVSLPDGTEALLSDSLASHDIENAKSVLIETNKDINIVFDGGGLHSVDANSYYAKNGASFSTVFIRTTAETNIKFWASTNPYAVINKIEIPTTTAISPTTPALGFDYYTGTSSTYQLIAEWEVSTGKTGDLHDISIGVASGGEDYAQFKVVIADTTMLEDKKCVGSATFSYNGSVQLSAGDTVSVYVKSDDTNTIKANGLITGRER